ncbi:hydroxyisourate hydrolase [Methylobacterium sp. JK268]
MGHLSTHVLDVTSGRPAAGVAVTLRRLGPDGRGETVAEAVTNADGRTDDPLLAGPALLSGTYELVFRVGAYFRGQGTPGLAEPPFLDEVPVRFGVADPDGRYHVPLLIAPWSYSTYRGS